MSQSSLQAPGLQAGVAAPGRRWHQGVVQDRGRAAELAINTAVLSASRKTSMKNTNPRLK